MRPAGRSRYPWALLRRSGRRPASCAQHRQPTPRSGQAGRAASSRRSVRGCVRPGWGEHRHRGCCVDTPSCRGRPPAHISLVRGHRREERGGQDRCGTSPPGAHTQLTPGRPGECHKHKPTYLPPRLRAAPGSPGRRRRGLCQGTSRALPPQQPPGPGPPPEVRLCPEPRQARRRAACGPSACRGPEEPPQLTGRRHCPAPAPGLCTRHPRRRGRCVHATGEAVSTTHVGSRVKHIAAVRAVLVQAETHPERNRSKGRSSNALAMLALSPSPWNAPGSAGAATGTPPLLCPVSPTHRVGVEQVSERSAAWLAVERAHLSHHPRSAPTGGVRGLLVRHCQRGRSPGEAAPRATDTSDTEAPPCGRLVAGGAWLRVLAALQNVGPDTDACRRKNQLSGEAAQP